MSTPSGTQDDKMQNVLSLVEHALRRLSSADIYFDELMKIGIELDDARNSVRLEAEKVLDERGRWIKELQQIVHDAAQGRFCDETLVRQNARLFLQQSIGHHVVQINPQ